MKLYLVRHAQSTANIKRVGELDPELTEIGLEQARRLSYFFKDIKLDKVYVSTLKRTKTTYEIFKEYLGDVLVEFRDDIVEHKMGIHRKEADGWEVYREMAEGEGKSLIDYKPEGGESLVETYERAGKFYKYLLEKHSKDSILIVSHGTFLKFLILNILGINLTEGKYFRLENASVSQFDIDKGKIKKFHIGDFHHLIIGEMNEKKSILDKIY